MPYRNGHDLKEVSVFRYVMYNAWCFRMTIWKDYPPEIPQQWYYKTSYPTLDFSAPKIKLLLFRTSWFCLIIFEFSKKFVFILIIVYKKFYPGQLVGVKLVMCSNDICEIVNSNFHYFITTSQGASKFQNFHFYRIGIIYCQN
jgi:hypothetical protein